MKMRKLIFIMVIMIQFFFGTASFGQLIDSLPRATNSFAMKCYYKKYSIDTLYHESVPNNFISVFRTCKSCQEEFVNGKIVEKTYQAEWTNEILPPYYSQRARNYYWYYRRTMSKKYSTDFWQP